jgi:hypothetical protein
MASSGPTKKQLQEAIKNYDIHAAIAILTKRSDWTNCDIREGDSVSPHVFLLDRQC